MGSVVTNGRVNVEMQSPAHLLVCWLLLEKCTDNDLFLTKDKARKVWLHSGSLKLDLDTEEEE